MRLSTMMLVLTAIVALLGCQSSMSHEGRPIILNPNGTWKYADNPVSLKSFTKPQSARATVKSKAGLYTLWFDETKWTTPETKINRETEFEFAHTAGDRFAYTISERTEVPRPALKK